MSQLEQLGAAALRILAARAETESPQSLIDAAPSEPGIRAKATKATMAGASGSRPDREERVVERRAVEAERTE